MQSAQASITKKLRISFTLGLFILCAFSGFQAYSTTYYSRATGSWTTNTTWSLASGGASVGAGVFPVAGDAVIIERGFTVTVNATSACASIQIGSPGTNGTGTLSVGAFTLTVSGNITVGGYGLASRTGTMTFTAAGSAVTCGSLTVGNSNATPGTPNSVSMAAGGTLTIGGAITINTGSINTFTKGTGTVVFTATNTLPSTVFNSFNNLTINGGTTSLGAATTVSSTIQVASGTLDLSIFSLTGGSVDMTGSAITGSGTLTLGGNVTTNSSASSATISAPISLGATRTITVANGTASPDLTVSSIISGGFGLIKAGAGELALSGSNTFTGGTTLNAGTLDINNSSALGTTAGTFTISGGTIDNTSGGSITTLNYLQAWNSNFTFTGTQNLDLGTGAVTPNASRQVTVSANTLTVGGVIGVGAISITKLGAGALTLSAANTFTGGMTLSAGTLNINNSNALGTAAGTFTISGGTIDNTTGGSITTLNYPQAWNGDFTFAGTQNLNLGTGAVTPNASRQVTVSANTLTVGGVIGGGAISLTKLGNGALTLSAANTFTGGATLSAGTLNINNSNALGTAAGTFTISGGTIDNTTGGSITTLNYPQAWNGDFTFAGTQNLNLGAGAVTPNASRQLTVSANTLTVGGVIGGGAINLTKLGSGTLTLSGANTFTGGTTLSAGTLNINNANALGTAAGTFTINGGTIDNTTGASITTLNYPQAWNGDFTFTGTRNLNLGAGAVSVNANRQITVNANTLTIGGTISSASFNLTKAGSGTLSFGANSVTINALNLSAGILTSTSGTLNIAGDFTSSGTFNHNSGTVNFNGSTAQAVAPVTYNNLTLTGVGQKNASGTINVAGNINNSSVFDMGGNTLSVTGTTTNTGTIRFSGASNGQAISSGTIEYYGASQTVAAGTYNNLTINQSSGEAVLGGTVTVNGILTLSSGNLDLGSFNLVLGSAATISVASPSASKMIIATGGEVRKTFTANGAFTFPIGDNTGTLEYSPVTLNVTGTAYSAAYVGISVVDSKHPNNSSGSFFITRYWNVSQSGITTCQATVTGTYVNADVNIGGTDASISAAQLNGAFNQSTNPWVKFSTLGANTLTATSASITAGQTSAFTGITKASPTVGIAGGGVTICSGSSASLIATGSGDASFTYSWSPTTGLSSAAIANPTASPTTTTAYTVTATDGNGITATNNTTITVDQQPTTAAAGSDINQCNTSSFTLAGNSPTTGTGTWSVFGVNPGVTITTPSAFNSGVTGLTGGNTVTLRWTISSGVCTSSFDDVVLTNYALAAPSGATIAGTDIAQCNNGSFTLAGTAATTGTGLWSVFSGAVTITTPTSNVSTVTGLAAGSSATLRWTITNGSCSTFDDVLLTNNAAVTTSNAGTDINQCNTSGFTLAGNNPTTGSGAWSVFGANPGITITTPAANNSGVTGLTAGNTVTLRWTITNGTCSSFDDVVLTNYALAAPSGATIAGTDIAQCNNGSFTLAGTAATTGTGAWSIQSGAVTITTPTSNVSTVTGLAAGSSATLRWTITNGSCSTFDDVLLTNNAAVTTSNAGTDINQCNTSGFTLAGNNPTTGSGAWSVFGANPGITITTPAANNSGVTGLTAGNTVTLRWTITNGTCSSFDDVILTNYALAAPSGATIAGTDIAQCNNGSFTLAGTAATTGTGAWSIQSGAVTITTPTSNVSTVTGLAAGSSATLRWTITNGSCSTFDDVLLTNNAAVTTSNAGTDINQCNTSGFTLAGNNPTTGSGAWSVFGANPGITITTPAANNSGVTGLTAGNTVTLRWTITNGTCSSFDDVILTNYALAAPSGATIAGTDIAQCNNGSFTLAGTAATTGTGLWSVFSGAVTITTPTSNVSTVTGLAAGSSATLRWTITNGSCSTFDDVLLTNNAAVTVSDAGTDINQCNTSGFTLAGNNPTTGSGAWSVFGANPGITITTPAANNSGVTGLTASNTVTLRWTITNGTCSSFDDVVLTNYALAAPSGATIAGTDIAQCNNGSFTLAGTAATTGTGLWSVFSGVVTITTPTSNVSTVTGLAAGSSATLRWTITNGSCSTFDDVLLTNNAAVTTSNAGTDINQCNTSGFTLAGNNPTTGSGAWSVFGANPGITITTPAANNSGVTGLTAGNTVTLRWTITNGTCSSFDDVILTNYALAAPSGATIAGTDIAQCNNGSFTLAGTAATTGTGLWSVFSGAVTITTPTSNVSTVTGLAAGSSATLRWTITNGSCSTFDDVLLTNNAAVTTSNAGTDINQCNTSGFTLAGNNPTTGSGAWSVFGANPGITITTPAANNSGVTGLTAGNTVTLRWTITNGTCSSFDDVVLTNYALAAPSGATIAGTDIAQCNNGSFTLAGTAATTGTGAWSIQSGAVTITTPTSNVSTVTGLAAGSSATLRWTITNGSCSTFDDVLLTNNAAVTTSNAGTDINQCNTSGFTLAGNNPTTGSGAWSVFGANPGITITTPAANNSGVTGLTAGNTVTLRWTITNGTCSSFDDVILTNYALAAPSGATIAGTDIAQCNNGSFTLAGTAATTGTGLWSVFSGAVTITTPTSNVSTVTGLAAGSSATLRWTITNGSCSTFDDVLLTNNAAVTVSNAGTDINQCNTSGFTLAGNSPTTGSGAWSVFGANPGITITTPAANNSGVTGLTASNTVTLRWTITNGTCSSFDDVVLTNYALAAPSGATIAGTDIAQCNNGSFTLAGTAATTGTGAWSIQSGAVTITTPTSNVSTVTGLAAGSSATLRWTITNGSCSTFDDVLLTNNAAVTTSNAGTDINQCNTSGFTLAGNNPTTGSGAWSVFGANPGITITTPAANNSGVTGLTAGNTVTLRWTITNGTCSSFDDVILTNYALAAPSGATIAGTDIAQCNNGSFTLAGTAATTGTGAWSIQSGAVTITTPTSNVSTVTGLAAGSSATLRWTITNGSCSTFDDVLLTNNAAVTVSNAGTDINQCNTTSFTLAGNNPTTGSGLWSVFGANPGITITTPAANNSGVTGLTAGNTVTLRWTITNGTCSSFDDVVLTNDNLPTGSLSGTTSICSGSNTNLTFALTGIGPFDVDYTDGSTTITLNGISNGNIVSVSPASTKTYSITRVKDLGTLGGCLASSFGSSVVVTVNLIPVISLGQAKTICSGDAVNYKVTLTPGGTPAGTIYNWSAPTMSDASSQGSAGTSVLESTSPTITDVLINTSSSPITATYKITPTGPNPTNCVGSQTSVVITINPQPAFSITNTTGTICSGSTTDITLTTPTVNGVVTLTTVNYAGATGGTQVNGNTYTSGQKITETLTNPGNTPLTISYTFSVAANGCNNPTTQTTNVILKAKPVITNTSTQLQSTICSGTALSFTPTSSIVGTTYSWTSSTSGTISGPSVTAGPSASIPIADSPVNTGNSPGFVTYSITPIFNGCSGTPVNYVVTVDPIPTISASGQAICSGGTTSVLITNPNSVSGTSYSWIIQGSSNVTGATAGSGSTISQTLTSTDGITSGTVVYRITPTANGCSGTFVDVTVTVNPVPVITNSAPQLQNTICSGTALNFTPTSTIGGTTYTWTSTVVGSISGAAASGGGAITNTLTNTSNTAGTVTYHITPTVGTCNGTMKDYTVTINPIPTISASGQAICSGGTTSVLITNPNSVSGTSFSWIIQGGSNVTGATAGSGSAISQTLTSTDGITSGTVVYRITPTANGCSGTFVDVTVTVNPVPVITNTAPQLQNTICSGTALNFTPTSTIGGTTYTWTSTVVGSISGAAASGGGAITNTLTNTSNTAGTVTYHITPTVGTCNGTVKDYTVTINPIPTISASGQAICSGGTTSVLITNPNSVSGTSYSWIIQGGSNVTGATAGSGSAISQTLTSTDGITSGTVVYRITPTANGCSGTFVDVTVTVNPVPVITNSAPQLQNTICSGTALNFTPTSTIGGTTYTWTSTVVGSISGATSSSSGAIVDALINTSNVAGTVTYHITPIVGLCSGIVKDYIVTVEPVPSANGSDVIICTGSSAIITINATPQNVSGTNYSWIVIPSSNVVGAVADNGSTINQTLTLNNSSVGSVIYRITPTANGCNGPTKDITATVDPVATVDAGSDYAVCEPTTITLTGTIGGAATSATWIVISGGSGSISSSSVSGNTVTAVYSVNNPLDVTKTIVFQLLTNDPDPSGPCNPVSDFLSVTVNKAATVVLPADYIVCEPSSISLNGTIGGSATTGLWSVVTGAGTLLATSVTSNTVSSSYSVNSADISSTLTFNLTTNDPDGLGPCQAASSNINIQVNQAARVFAPANLAICASQPSASLPSIILGGSIGGSAASSTWTGGAGSYSNNSDPNATYTIGNSENASLATGPITVILTLTAPDPDGSGPCSLVSTQTSIKINPLPSVQFSGFPQNGNSHTGLPNYPFIAANDPAISLTGFEIGGLFSSPSSFFGSQTQTPFDQVAFDPSVQPVGLNTVIYTYTNGNGCTNSDTQVIQVNAVTSTDFTLIYSSGSGVPQDQNFNYKLCAEQGYITLVGNPLPNGDPVTKFDIIGANSSFIINSGSQWYLNTDGLPAGTYTLTYTFRNSQGVTTPPKYKTIDVYAHPNAGIIVNSTCVTSAVAFQDASTMPSTNPFGDAINGWDWNLDDGITRSSQNPSVSYDPANPGTKNIFLTVFTNQGCSGTATTTLKVGDFPIPDFKWSNICTFDKTNFSDKTTFKSGQGTIVNYTWDFGDSSPLISGAPLSSVSGSSSTTGTYDKPIHVYSINGNYDVKMSVVTDVGCVQSLTQTVNILITTTGNQTPSVTHSYFEKFNFSDGGWIPQAFNATNSTSTNVIPGSQSWVWGLPAGAFIPASATDSVWWTGSNNGTYFDYESSSINGPCFDLTQLNRPVIALDYWIDANENYDGAVMQYSTDGGNSWFIIGPLPGLPVSQRKQGINWYKPGATIVGNPGQQNSGPYGWTGSSGTWINGRFNLDIIPDVITSGISSRKQVRIRLAFATNGPAAGSSVYNGFAFDNIFVGEKTKNVLVEHFTNATQTGSRSGDDYFDNLYAAQLSLRNGSTDFVDLQYHVRFPQPDDLSQDNNDASARALYYGVQQVPYSVMDGNLSGKFQRGDFSQINAIEIDSGALRLPRLNIISIDTTSLSGTYSNHTFSAKLKIKAEADISAQLMAQIVLVEDPVYDKTYSATDTVYHNIVRKLIYGTGGYIQNVTLLKGDVYTFSKSDVQIESSIGNPDSLHLIAFVQDYSTKEILQSVIFQVNRKRNRIITAIKDPRVAQVALENVKIYPNPANGKFNFGLPGDFPANGIWKISDQRGINVMSGDFNDTVSGIKTVEINTLPNGVYFVAIGTPGSAPAYKKLVILNSN